MIISVDNITAEPIGNIGDHMEFDKFVRFCDNGSFIDYDGFGHLATETMETNLTIIPSHITKGAYNDKLITSLIGKALGYVVWYNR